MTDSLPEPEPTPPGQGRSARAELIRRLSEDSYGGIATLHDVTEAEQLVDACIIEALKSLPGQKSADAYLATRLADVIRKDADEWDGWPEKQAAMRYAADLIALHALG